MPYQGQGEDSVERANGVVQLLRRQAAQQVPDGADGLRHRRHVGRRLQGQNRGKKKNKASTVSDVPSPGRRFLKCCFSTDLGAQQGLRLSVVGAEDLLQAQSEGGGGEGKSGLSKHFGRMFSLQTDGGLHSKRVHTSAERLTCWRRRHRPNGGAGRDGTESRRLQP